MSQRFFSLIFAAFLLLPFIAAFHFSEAAIFPPKACADGVDNDGDGLIDLAQDFGCTNADDNDERFPECFDGIDNDGDGMIDFPADPQCSAIIDTDEWHPSQCTDGVDNDGEGGIDAADDDCVNDGYSRYTPVFDQSEREVCSDGIDNDFDGVTDYPADPSCESLTYTTEGYKEQCRDGIDNDGDGEKDYLFGFGDDPGCLSFYDNSELGSGEQCRDGIDNDLDGATDSPADIGCGGNPFKDDERNQCSDGFDNNSPFANGAPDNYVDYPNDDGCFSQQDNNEGDPRQCWDGRDNDGDGFIDYGEDLGCTSALYDDDERPSCDDGADNDSDFQYDAPYTYGRTADDSCASKMDNDELSPVQCNDGIDNDGDEKIDYGTDSSNDSGCANIYDNREYSTPQCQDGIDNDGDEDFDYSMIPFQGDSECTGPTDDDEFAQGNINGGYLALVSSSFAPEHDIFSALIASVRKGWEMLLARIANAVQPGPPTVNLSVAEDPTDQDTVEIVTTEAYDTHLNIAWAATNACSCTGSKSPNNADWWTTGGGVLREEASYNSGDIVVDVTDPPQIEYTLMCYGYKGVSCDDTSPYVNDPASDTVTVTPMWNPWWATIVKLTGPAEAAPGDNVVLNYELYDIKECVATSPNDSWWGTAQNDEIKNIGTGNIQPREGGGSIGVGTITEDTTFALSCIGFDNGTYTDSVTVDYVPPIPFFSVTTVSPSQTILITLGTGAGTISNKAGLEVYTGGGFSGDVDLSANGVPAGFTSHFSQSSFHCSGGASRCGTSDFWVEMTGSGQTEGVYPVTITATAVSDGSTKTTLVNLRVRRFTPAFEEI